MRAQDEIDHGLLTRYSSALVHEDKEADTESEREPLISRGRKKEEHYASSMEERCRSRENENFPGRGTERIKAFQMAKATTNDKRCGEWSYH